MAGLFVSIEGIDGTGKSTQVKLLCDFLTRQGIDFVYTREPGGTRLGEEIRAILLNPQNQEMSALTEMLLYAASRAQLVKETIVPALRAGKIVICDRYVDSSIVYQGVGLGIGKDVVKAVNRVATGDLWPDLTLLFAFKKSQEGRVKRHGGGNQERMPDRIEARNEEFHRRVEAAYRQLADQYRKRIVVLDAEQRREDISNEVCSLVLSKYNSIRDM